MKFRCNVYELSDWIISKNFLKKIYQICGSTIVYVCVCDLVDWHTESELLAKVSVLMVIYLKYLNWHCSISPSLFAITCFKWQLALIAMNILHTCMLRRVNRISWEFFVDILRYLLDFLFVIQSGREKDSRMFH